MGLVVDFTKKHPINVEAKTIVVRKCWWVYFDVNGNAPSDADIVPCATKELADEVLEWFKSAKDEDIEPYVVLDGKKYSEMLCLGVEGYNFDTCYSVRAGEAEESTIMTSLSDVVRLTEIFQSREKTTEADGVYVGDGEPFGATDEEDPG